LIANISETEQYSADNQKIALQTTIYPSY